jgi:hypothetical protein
MDLICNVVRAQHSQWLSFDLRLLELPTLLPEKLLSNSPECFHFSFHGVKEDFVHKTLVWRKISGYYFFKRECTTCLTRCACGTWFYATNIVLSG